MFWFGKLRPYIKDWQIPNPEYLWLAGKPEREEGWMVPQLIKLSEIEKNLGVKWTEIILKKGFKKSFCVNEEVLPSISHEEYSQRQIELHEKCVIRWLGQEIGWALTLRAGKTLNKGIVTCYTGVATTIKPDQSSSYAAREYFFSLASNGQENIGVDAREYGNMARLLPFLLNDEHLANFMIDPAVKDRVALANLRFQPALIRGIKVPGIYAPDNITAPEDQELLLGISYSLPYLYKMQKENKGFKFIDKNTFKTIDAKFYQLKIITVNLEELSFSFHIPRLRIMAALNLPNLKHKTIGFDENKNEYYEVTVADYDMYEALMQDPQSNEINVKPVIKKVNMGHT